MQHMPIVKPVIIRFMYEDDMILLYITLSFQIKKNQIPNILPMWAFVPLKCQQNFEILQLVWILAPNDRDFSKHFGLPPFIK